MSTDPPRPAASVLLLRDAPCATQVEVFMVERSARVDFPGLHVFPGGKVEAEDADVAADADLVAPGQAPSGVAPAYAVTAVRECFEETGVLLARDRDGALPEAWDPERLARLDGVREAVAGGRLLFAEVLRSEGLRPALDRLAYLSHWITPPSRARRYDTRFFVAPAPELPAFRHDAGELVASTWVGVRDALEHGEAGRWQMIAPTVTSLRTLAPHRDVGALLRAVRSGALRAAPDETLRAEGMQPFRDR